MGRGVAKNCGFLAGPDYNTYPKIMTPKKEQTSDNPHMGRHRDMHQQEYICLQGCAVCGV